MKTDLFQSCGHCWVFQICWHIKCSTFTASSFRIWSSSTGIPSPPLALFVMMLSKAHYFVSSSFLPFFLHSLSKPFSPLKKLLAWRSPVNLHYWSLCPPSSSISCLQHWTQLDLAFWIWLGEQLHFAGFSPTLFATPSQLFFLPNLLSLEHPTAVLLYLFFFLSRPLPWWYIQSHSFKHCVAAAAAKSPQSCPTPCNPIDGSPPGSPIPGILQARTLEWVAISFSNAWKWNRSVLSNSSDPMDCSLPGFSVHGIFQARVLEWVSLPSLEKGAAILKKGWG